MARIENAVQKVIADFRNDSQPIKADEMNGSESLSNVATTADGDGSSNHSHPRHVPLAIIERLLSTRMEHVSRIDWYHSPLTAARLQLLASNVGVVLYPSEALALVQKFVSADASNTIDVDTFIAFLSALRTQPMSTMSDSFALTVLKRAPIPISHEVNAEIRLISALSELRKAMYAKSSHYHTLFRSLQNENKQVAIDELPEALARHGLPLSLISPSELQQQAELYASVEPGYLSYQEFLSFFMLQSRIPKVVDINLRAAADALLKINNSRTRKIFKDLDTDFDGLITVDELADLLVQFGTNKEVAYSAKCRSWIESFDQKKPGFFNYNEFLSFVTQRTTQGGIDDARFNVNRAITKLSSTATPAELFEQIVATMRNSSLSIESVLEHFTDDDHNLSEENFFQALSALGFEILSSQSHALFAALAKNNKLSAHEFAMMIVNPQRSKLSIKIRHAPGGESSVPLGSYVDPSVYETPRKSATRIIDSSSKLQHYSINKQQDTSNQSEITTSRTLVKHDQSFGRQTSIDLSFTTAETPARVARPETRQFDLEGAPLDAPVSQKVADPLPVKISAAPDTATQQPPGGVSTIDLSGRTQVPFRPSLAVFEHSQQRSDSKKFQFDPNHPTEQLNVRGPVGGADHLTADQGLVGESLSVVRSYAMKQPPGGNATINLAGGTVSYKPVSRIMASPGGNSTVDLTHGINFEEPKPSDPRPHDKPNILLAHDPEKDLQMAGPFRRQLAPVDGTPHDHENLLDHPTSRQQAIEVQTERRHRAPVAGVVTSTIGELGDPSAIELLKNYQSVESVDEKNLKSIGSAVYNHNSRVRHTFQEFTNGQGPTLSKVQFKDGLAALNVKLSDSEVDQIFASYDADEDGEITYSEFVKIIASS